MPAKVLMLFVSRITGAWQARVRVEEPLNIGRPVPLTTVFEMTCSTHHVVVLSDEQSGAYLRVRTAQLIPAEATVRLPTELDDVDVPLKDIARVFVPRGEYDEDREVTEIRMTSGVMQAHARFELVVEKINKAMEALFHKPVSHA